MSLYKRHKYKTIRHKTYFIHWITTFRSEYIHLKNWKCNKNKTFKQHNNSSNDAQNEIPKNNIVPYAHTHKRRASEQAKYYWVSVFDVGLRFGFWLFWSLPRARSVLFHILWLSPAHRFDKFQYMRSIITRSHGDWTGHSHKMHICNKSLALNQIKDDDDDDERGKEEQNRA